MTDYSHQLFYLKKQSRLKYREINVSSNQGKSIFCFRGSISHWYLLTGI